MLFRSGLNQTEAAEQAASFGLELRIAETTVPVSDEALDGLVASQNPDEGVEVTKGAVVTVTLGEEGRRVIGHGAHSDIIVASAKAYIHALNKLAWHKHRRGLSEPKGV